MRFVSEECRAILFYQGDRLLPDNPRTTIDSDDLTREIRFWSEQGHQSRQGVDLFERKLEDALSNRDNWNARLIEQIKKTKSTYYDSLLTIGTTLLWVSPIWIRYFSKVAAPLVEKQVLRIVFQEVWEKGNH